MPFHSEHTFRPGDLIVHRGPTQATHGGIAFGETPRHVAAANDTNVFVIIDGEKAMFSHEHVNFAPGTKVSDPLGRVLTVVHEVEPAPGPWETRVAKGGAREWAPTGLLISAPTEPELTLWGTRSRGSITWWPDELTARHAAKRAPSVEVLTMTGRPTVVDRSPAAGHLALVDVDELRRALQAGTGAIATLISRLRERPDFLTEVEEALGTPAGIHRLIGERRGTTD